MGFFDDLWYNVKGQTRKEWSKAFLDKDVDFERREYFAKPTPIEDKPLRIICNPAKPDTNTDWYIGEDEDNNLPTYGTTGTATQLVEQEAQLYYQKQQAYYDMLTQQLAWQQEKEKTQLYLQQQKQQMQYDLDCKRLAMEKELRQYELRLQDQDIHQHQALQIRLLQEEIKRLQSLLKP